MHYILCNVKQKIKKLPEKMDALNTLLKLEGVSFALDPVDVVQMARVLILL